MTDKLYKTRDSATSALRKLGLKPRDYDLFIDKLDGMFRCRVEAAAAHLASLLQPAPAAKETRPAKAPAAKRVGVSQTARDLILAGKTNAEVWAVLQAQFKLDDGKKHYPTWYRSELKRKGLLAA
jgi:hypothetical protein